MKTSESVRKIIESNGNRFVESKELVKIANEILPLKKSNKKLDGIGFMQRLVFGISDCWYFRGFIDDLGYGVVSGKKAHRMSYYLFNGKIKTGMSVLHKCDVRNCVNPDHLFIGTQLDNMRDCKAKGRIKSPVPRFAEKNPISKINRVIVYEMKKIRSETGMSYKKIAKMFNISTMTAYRAVKEISWK
jgi:hypothetical protein